MTWFSRNLCYGTCSKMGDRFKKGRRFRGNLWVKFQYILHYRETLGRNSARADCPIVSRQCPLAVDWKMSWLFHVIVDIINTNPKIVFAVSIDRYCTETVALSAKHVRVTDCLSRCRPTISICGKWLWRWFEIVKRILGRRKWRSTRNKGRTKWG